MNVSSHNVVRSMPNLNIKSPINIATKKKQRKSKGETKVVHNRQRNIPGDNKSKRTGSYTKWWLKFTTGSICSKSTAYYMNRLLSNKTSRREKA